MTMGEVTVKHGSSYFMGTLVSEADGVACVIPQRSCGCIPGLIFCVEVLVPSSLIVSRHAKLRGAK